MADIRRRIKSVTSTEHITNAMKLVSASKLRKAKNTFEKTRDYFHYVTESISDIFYDANEVPGEVSRRKQGNSKHMLYNNNI